VCRSVLPDTFWEQLGDEKKEVVQKSQTIEPSPSPPLLPPSQVTPSRYVMITNLGNERKLDWNELFQGTLRLYGALHLYIISSSTGLVQFSEISQAEAAIINTDSTSINGQKIICSMAADEHLKALENPNLEILPHPPSPPSESGVSGQESNEPVQKSPPHARGGQFRRWPRPHKREHYQQKPSEHKQKEHIEHPEPKSQKEKPEYKPTQHNGNNNKHTKKKITAKDPN